jgi:hypothetical protein
LVRTASSAYQEAVMEFGMPSPAAKTAKAELDEAYSMLYQTVSAIRKDTQGLRSDEQRMVVAERDLRITNTKIDIGRQTADINADSKKLARDTSKSLEDQTEVREARSAHERAALLFGMMGPQAQAADMRLVNATAALHAQRAVVRRDLTRLAIAGKRLNTDRLALNRDERERRSDLLARFVPYEQ